MGKRERYNMSQNTKNIIERIEYYLDKGLTDKQDIYTKVVDDLNVPRPTVRRIARDLRTKYQTYIQILQSEFVIPKEIKN